MHSLEGALAETLYIYAPCVTRAMEIPNPALFSMGLGLGYNEILTSALALKSQRKPKIYSFEIVPELRDFFTDWLEKRNSQLSPCYDRILSLMASHFEMESGLIKSNLQELHQKGDFKIFSEVERLNPYGLKFQGILYDAFSSKTSPTLWEENHLNQFIKEYSDLGFCTLSTYASTGSLKRALISNGFNFKKKKGFGMKRESTFAWTGENSL